MPEKMGRERGSKVPQGQDGMEFDAGLWQISTKGPTQEEGKPPERIYFFRNCFLAGMRSRSARAFTDRPC